MDWLFKIRKGKMYIFGIKLCCNPLFFDGYDNFSDDGYDSSDISDHDSDEP